MGNQAAGRRGGDAAENKMFKPKKQLGQNFLKNVSIAKKIVDVAEIEKDDFVIEIGPGTGILTDELVKTGANILAIEKDFDLVAKLQERYKNAKNIKISHQDILFFDPQSIDSEYKVVANIPYNITSPIIRKFLENSHKPEVMILMVQKEVAERITAKPGSSERGLLTLIVEFYSSAEKLYDVKKENFYPVPKVDSAVIKIKPNKSHIGCAVDKVQTEIFFKLVKAGFASKRQQIHNSLAATLRWEKPKVEKLLSEANIDPKLRAEDLSLEDWVRLYENFIVLYNRIDEQ